MLAEGRNCPVKRRIAPDSGPWAKHLHVTCGGAHRDDVVLRMGQQIIQIGQPPKSDVGCIQPGNRRIAGQAGKNRRNPRIQCLAVGDPQRIAGKARIGGQCMITQHIGAQPQPFALILNREQDSLSVSTVKCAIRGNGGVFQPGPPRGFAAIAGLQIGDVHPVGHRMKQRHIDDPPLTGPFSGEQRLQDRLKRRHPCRNIADRYADPGRSVFCAVNCAQTAFRLNQQIIRLLVAVGPIFAIARHRADNQPRKPRPQAFGPKPQPRHSAGGKVLDKDIRPGQHFCDHRQIGWIFQIQPDGFLAPVQPDEIGTFAHDQRVIAPREIAVMPLDLDDPRPGVTLTQAGEVLLSHARAIVTALETATDAVRQSGTEAVGDISFGLPSSVSMVLSVPLAETVRLELPRVRLRAIEAMSGFIQTWLEDLSIDLGILYDVSAVRHLKARLLMTEELCFFSAADAWPFSTPPGTPVPMADLAQVELVLPSRHHGLRIMIDRLTRANGVHLNVTTEMDALSQIKALVARGSSHTVLAPAAAFDFVERGALIMAPIVNPQMTRPVYLVRNPAKPMTTASRALERITVEVIRDLIARGIWRADGSAEGP